MIYLNNKIYKIKNNIKYNIKYYIYIYNNLIYYNNLYYNIVISSNIKLSYINTIKLDYLIKIY
jgi:hypothetical protein